MLLNQTIWKELLSAREPSRKYNLNWGWKKKSATLGDEMVRRYLNMFKFVSKCLESVSVPIYKAYQKFCQKYMLMYMQCNKYFEPK